jgi:hypothetical protein
MSLMSKKMIVGLALGLVAFAGTGIGYSSSVSGDRQEHGHVYGGGRFGPGCFDESGQTTFCVPVGKAFSLDSEIGSRTRATGNLAYQRFAVKAVVTCTTIDGNRAAVGGLSLADATGQLNPPVPFLIYFVDNGPPASATRDRVSSIFAFGPGETFPGEPSNFPWECPASATAFPGAGYMDLNAPDGQGGGDVVVDAAMGQ